MEGSQMPIQQAAGEQPAEHTAPSAGGAERAQPSPSRAGDQPRTPGKKGEQGCDGPTAAPASSDGVVQAATRETPEKDRNSKLVAESPEAAACQQLYYRLLRAVFHDLELYVPETSMLDSKKQLLAYHHAAMIFELRKPVIGALRKEDNKLEELPSQYQRALCTFIEAEGKAGSLPEPRALREKFVFGHEGVIKFVEPPSLPKEARSSCVILREKPHCSTDQVKSISPFRELIRFRCTTNPLSLVDEVGLGLVIMVEGTMPRAFIVISPLLRDPSKLAEACSAHTKVTLSSLHTQVGTMVNDMIGREVDAWRAFVQRRASIVMKGSLNAIAHVLRKVPNSSAGSDAVVAETIRELEEQLEKTRETLKERESEVKAAARKAGLLNARLKQTTSRLESARAEAASLAEAREAGGEKKAGGDASKLKERLKAMADKFKKAKGKVRKLKLKYEQSKQTAQEADPEKLAECIERAELAERTVIEQADELETLRSRIADGDALQRKCVLTAAEVVDLQAAGIAMRSRLEERDREMEQLADSNFELLHSVAHAQAALRQKQSSIAATRGLEREVKTAKLAAEKARAQAAAAEAHAKQQLQAKAELLKEKSEEVSRAAAKASAASTAAVKAQAECELKVSELETLRGMNIDLRTQVAGCRDEVLRAEARAAAAARLAQEAEQRAAEAERRLAAAVEEAKSEAREQSLEAARAQAEAEAKRLRGEADARRREVEESRGTVASLRVALESEKSMRDAAHAEAQLEATRLRGEVAVKANEAEAYQRAALAMRATLRAREKEAEAATLEAARAKGELAVAANQAEQLRTANVDLRAAAAEAREQAARCAASAEAAAEALASARAAEEASGAAVAGLRAELSERAAAQEALARAAAEAKEEASSAAERCMRREAEAREVENAARAETKVKEGEIAALRAFIADLQRVRKSAMDRAHAAEERAAALEPEVPRLRAELEVSAQAVSHLSSANVALRAEVAEAAGQRRAAAERAEVAGRSPAESAGLRARLAEAVAQGEARVAEARLLESRIQELSVEASDAKASAASAAEEVAAARREAERSCAALREEAALAAARLQVRSAEAARLTEECARLRAQEALAQRKLAVASTTLQSVSSTCRGLRAQVRQTEESGAARSDELLFEGVWSTVEAAAATRALRRRRFFPQKRRTSATSSVPPKARRVSEEGAAAAGARGPAAGAEIEERAAPSEHAALAQAMEERSAEADADHGPRDAAGACVASSSGGIPEAPAGCAANSRRRVRRTCKGRWE